MNIRRSAILACAALAAALAAPAWAGPPAAAELREASVAVGYETRDRCPGLIQTSVQEPSAALIVLVVGPSGVPSQPSLKTSSGSESLDTAAMSCVVKLRFLPAVRAGEGSAMASWQEIAWKWGREHFTQTPPSAAAAPVAAIATPGVGAGGAEVRVCVDESGRLTQDAVVTRSSGDPGLDQAALKIARSGAPYYRPAGATSLTGCAQLAIKFETK